MMKVAAIMESVTIVSTNSYKIIFKILQIQEVSTPIDLALIIVWSET